MKKKKKLIKDQGTVASLALGTTANTEQGRTITLITYWLANKSWNLLITVAPDE